MQEDTPMNGGINAEKCGMGKTSQTFMLIFHSAMEKLAGHEQGESDIDFRPTNVSPIWQKSTFGDFPLRRLRLHIVLRTPTLWFVL
jgi:hypothetical protein